MNIAHKLLFLCLIFQLSICWKSFSQCSNATIPKIGYSIDTIDPCGNSNVITLYIDTGSLNSDTAWHWYQNSCGSFYLGSGDTIQTTIGGASITYFARGEGNCAGTAACGSEFVYGLDTAGPVPLVDPLPIYRGQCEAGIFSSLNFPSALDACDGPVGGWTPNVPVLQMQGTDTVIWSYADNLNNIRTQKMIIIVDDTIAPVPDIQMLPIIRAQCDTTISVFPSSIDNCAGHGSSGPIAGPLVATTNSPLTYNIQGRDTIIWIFDDTRGNVTYQHQIVEVKDTIGPDLICPSDTIVIAPLNQSSIPILNLSPIASDNCGGSVFTYYEFSGATTGTYSGDASGKLFNIGLTNLEYIAEDGLGNKSTCQVKITVNSTIGIFEEKNNSHFSVNPNPNDGSFYLNSNHYLNQVLSIVVYDVEGKKVIERSFNNQKSNFFNFNTLTTGSFILSINSDSEILYNTYLILD